MRHLTQKRWVLFPALIFVVLARGYGQPSASWRNYNLALGSSGPGVRSVTIAEGDAVLTVSLASARACLFDGYDAKPLPMPEGAARIYQNPAGQLWTVTDQGLWTMKDQEWKLHPLPDLATVPSANQVSLCPGRLNVVLCLLPERLVECSAEDPANFRVQTVRDAAHANIGQFISMAIGVEEELWIVGERGLARLSGPRRSLAAAGDWREFIPPESLHIQHLQHPQPDGDGVTLLADSSTDSQSLVVSFDGEQWRSEKFSAARLSFAWCGPDKSLWACSSNQLFHRTGGDWAVEVESSNRQYYDVGVDWRGTFWLATSAGLVRFTPGLWRPVPADDKISAAVQSLVSNGRWPEAPAQIARFDMDPARTSVMKSDQDAATLKPIDLLTDGRVCCATLPDKESNQRNRLEAFDGTSFHVLPMFVPQPAAAANISCFLAAQAGDLWLAGDFGTAWLHGRWTVFPSSDSAAPQGVGHLMELPSGQIWSASRERIWSFDGKNWSLVRGGFNHLDAMICARDGGVWAGGDGGVTRFVRGHWIENGVQEGLDGSAICALCEDQHGIIRSASVASVAIFHPEADNDPPRTLITPMSARGKNIPQDGVIDVKFGGRDKWDVTPPDRLLFSYRLDAGEWSPFAGADNQSFSDLPAGKHYFQVRAMDRAGNIDPEPAELDFAVVPPWYKESRLVLIASAGALAAGFFAVLAWRRHQALVLSYAQVEKQVAERTRQLERASQELLQSQKMRALGTLAAGIAHDFNNILSIVKGSAQIIEDNLDNPGKIRTRADRIKTVVEQGSAVVQAMLGFSRGSDEVLERCEINPVIDNTIRLLGDRFLRDVDLRFDRARGLPFVRASPSLIQQSMLNFIFNAAESMSGRKHVVITTALAGILPERMALPPGTAAAYVVVAVRDFGCGIPPENLPRVFEPFFTTKALSTRRGTGLGLSVVYELAKKMEAGLALESTVGQGTVFSLFLPAIPKVEPAPKVEA